MPVALVGRRPRTSQCGSTVTSTPSLRFSEKTPSQSSISRNGMPAMDVMQSPARRPGCPGVSSMSSTTMPYHVGSASMPAPVSRSTRSLRVRTPSSSAPAGGSKTKPFGAASPPGAFLALRASKRRFRSSASSGVAEASMPRDFKAASAPATSSSGKACVLASAMAACKRPMSWPLAAAASSFAAAARAASFAALAFFASRSASTDANNSSS
mmetsp:Transcript_4198/g.11719  ORF Transcript_4198/g.11719 Transcript_4198/m.11719 type:complete len:212 (+) Transcript_4198:187-822(+)